MTDEASSCWRSGKRFPRLAGNAVHVWRAALSAAPVREEGLRAVLSADELERAGRYRFEKDRRHYVAGRAILRLLLGRYLESDPSALVFAYGEHGKPFLAAADAARDLQFNMSHAGGTALFAFALERAVGVDIEETGRAVDRDAIARRFFSPAEAARFLALPAAEKQAAFFRCWTRKEAYIKAHGLGVTMGLETFEVSFAPGEPARLLRTSPEAERERWSLLALDAGPGFEAALVVEGAPPELHCREWENGLLPEGR